MWFFNHSFLITFFNQWNKCGHGYFSPVFPWFCSVLLKKWSKLFYENLIFEFNSAAFDLEILITNKQGRVKYCNKSIKKQKKQKNNQFQLKRMKTKTILPNGSFCTLSDTLCSFMDGALHYKKLKNLCLPSARWIKLSSTWIRFATEVYCESSLSELFPPRGTAAAVRSNAGTQSWIFARVSCSR